jgi:hypothetical protein
MISFILARIPIAFFLVFGIDGNSTYQAPRADAF